MNKINRRIDLVSGLGLRNLCFLQSLTHLLLVLRLNLSLQFDQYLAQLLLKSIKGLLELFLTLSVVRIPVQDLLNQAVYFVSLGIQGLYCHGWLSLEENGLQDFVALQCD